MSQQVRPLKPIKAIQLLQKQGFRKTDQKGSHVYFEHADGRSTSVPMHKGEDIGRGLMRKILQDIGMSWENFVRYK